MTCCASKGMLRTEHTDCSASAMLKAVVLQPHCQDTILAPHGNKLEQVFKKWNAEDAATQFRFIPDYHFYCLPKSHGVPSSVSLVVLLWKNHLPTFRANVPCLCVHTDYSPHSTSPSVLER